MATRPEIPKGKLTISQLIDSTRSNFGRKDWARANAKGRPFSGDNGRVYDTRMKLNKASRAPWGIRFQTTTTAPEEFGTDAKGRFPRQWVQYVELPFDYDRTNVRGLKSFRVFCNCPRYKFAHHYVLWQHGHAPKPKGKGLAAPDYTARGSRKAAVCKHLVLALLHINKISTRNQLPTILPDKAWAEIERYWAAIENGNTNAVLENLKSAPDSVRKLATKIATEGNTTKPGNKFTRADWSGKGLKITRRKV